MEESGENWPSDSDLEISDDVIFEDGEYESKCDDDEDHYCSESGNPTDRERRNEREVAEKLLALSATIPGLKKMDDTSIIEKVKNYVKQLQERVRELEKEVGSNNICSNKDTTSCKMNSHDYNSGTSNILPEVKARVLQKEVLIIIHCEKQKDVMLKILTHLENLHLSLVNSSVLRFGKSNLDITIVAQMGDGYNIKLDELVQTLRLAIST